MAHALQAPLPAPLAQWTRLVMALGECTTEFRTRLNKGQAIGFITAENMEKSHCTMQFQRTYWVAYRVWLLQ